MKYFLTKTTHFLILILLYYLLLASIVLISLPNLGYGYFLGDDNHTKKIVLVGSSNIRHNFDFELLNNAFNSYSIVGLDVDASSGLYILLYKLKKLKLTHEDIVILCLPYHLYNDDMFLNISSKRKSYSSKLIISALLDFPILTIKNLLSLNFYNLKNATFVREDEKFSYFKNTFFPSPLTSDSLYLNCFSSNENKFFISDSSIDFNKNSIIRINDWMNEQFDAKILYRYPSLKKDNYQLNDDKMSFLKENFTFTNSLNNSIYDCHYFFNQWWHLNYCGSELNTSRLIKEIKNELNTN